MTTPKLLVIDAYPDADRQALEAVGGTAAGTLYTNLLRSLLPEAQVDVFQPADRTGPRRELPPGVALQDYDGMVWTGSSLTIHDTRDARVLHQVELARCGLGAGVPSFGSCWAAQLAVVAAGGACARSPAGREFGVGRKIRLSDEGRDHPMYAGKVPVFDAFTSHQDEITHLPPGSQCLASNEHSAVQAVSVSYGRGRFWAVQYHPEYSPGEIASLCRLRAPGLVEQGLLETPAGADGFIQAMQALEQAPERRDLAWLYGLGPDLLEADARHREVRNWLEHAVVPGASLSRAHF